MSTKIYLQINYPKNEEMKWLDRIQNRLHQSSSEALRKRVAAWRESGLGELALTIGTRTTVLRYIVGNLTREVAEIERDLGRRKADVREAIEGRHGIGAGDSPFKLMLFSHAFLFESKALSEFIRDFVKCFLEKMLGENLRYPELEQRLAANEVQDRWREPLKKHRDFLLHKGGAWPILEAVDEAHERFDLVFLKKISYTGSIEEKDTIHFEELREILSGFQRAVPAIEGWLIKKIGNFEKRESARAS